jgi:phosphoglycolate phosphatase
VDSRRDIAASAAAALAAVGLPPRDPREVASFVGHGARRLVARCVEPHVELLEPALAAFREHHAVHLLDTTVPYPGISALLRTLRGRGDLAAVATNKPGAFARTICGALFPGLLSPIVGGDEAPLKPDPGMLRDILREVGAAPAEAVFVGDMALDEETASAAAVRFVGAGWGFGGLRPGCPVAHAPGDLVSV